MKSIITMGACAWLCCAFAVSDDDTIEYTGGKITKPAQGLVVIVDAQNRVKHDMLANSAAQFLDGFHLPSTTVWREWFALTEMERLKTEMKATALVVVTDDAALPMSVVAPEANWAVANVAAVSADTDDRATITSRTIKMMRRSLLLALGGTFSPDGKLLTAPVKNASDLDVLSDTRVVMEQMFGVVAHARKLGLAATKTTTYREACEQGWAPPPTNDIQKAVWDDVHTPPKNPMKIEFDPKKGR